MSTETQKCSSCKCKKLLKLFKFRENIGQYFKTCIQCGEKHKCTKCDFKCYRNSDLQKHIKQVHDKIKDKKCTLCDYMCSTNGNLQRHIKQVHDKIKDCECTQCDYKCSLNGHLQSHIKQVHDKIKDCECTQCDYKCSLNSDLQKHIKTCTGHRNISGLEMCCIESLQDLGFEEDIHYLFNNTYEPLTKFSNKYLRPDIRLINHNIIIELDGRQHSEPVTFGSISQEQAQENFKITQENDKLKNDFCKKFGYKMIRIPYTDIRNILSILHYELEEIAFD